MRNPYHILEVDPKATPEEIKLAYRALARKHHQDGEGKGAQESEARMREINAAYEILSDPEKRALFDETGILGGRDELYVSFCQLFDAALDLVLCKSYPDPITAMRATNAEARATIDSSRQRARSKRESLEEIRKNIRLENQKEPDVLAVHIEKSLEALNGQIEAHTAQLAILQRVAKMIDGYAWTGEMPSPSPGAYFTIRHGNPQPIFFGSPIS